MTNKKNDKTATELLLMRTKCLPGHRSYYRHPHRSCARILPPASDGRRKMQGFINPGISPRGLRLLLPTLGYEIWGSGAVSRWDVSKGTQPQQKGRKAI